MKPAGLILAGGAGTRLGGADKALLPLDGETLLARLQTRLAPQVTALALSANGDATRFAGFGLVVLPDAQLGKGPLAGIAAGLAWAQARGAEALLSVPVDTPFIPLDLAETLSPAPAVACHASRQHHLVALWPVRALPALLDFLRTDPHLRVRDALALCHARPVDFPGADDPFANINTPDDLAAATRRLSPIFAFESDFAGSLRCIPMAVRLKLDLSGIKLSLRQWSQFTRDDRAALLTEPDLATFTRIVETLVATKTDEPLKPLPAAEAADWEDTAQVPAAVSGFAQEQGVAAPSKTQWATLSRLQRFTLLKLSRAHHDNINFLPALREFGLLKA